MTNPFAVPHNPQSPVPGATNRWTGNGAYAVPDIPESTDPEYTIAYSPALKATGSSDGTALPDDIRTGRREPPVRNWNAPRQQAIQNSDLLERHAQDTYADMWHVRQDRVSPPRMPIWEQDRPPTRPTQTMSPTGYLVRAPKHHPRNAAEIFGDNATLHFSLADHRRVYPVMTQKPQGRVGVNTWRASPQPWDEALYNPPPAGYESLNTLASSRSFRAM